MPSIFTHAFVGAAAGRLMPLKRPPARFWALSILLPVLPDADILAFNIGLPYGHFLGHRGFFHSIPFALILAMVVATVFFRNYRIFSKDWLLLAIYFFLLTASHGILDAFTSGGKGIALLAPFDNTRYFSPFTPIRVSPIRVSAFFGTWGLKVMINEIIWVWLPTTIIVAGAKIIRFRR